MIEVSGIIQRQAIRPNFIGELDEDLSFAKTASGGQAVDLSVLIRRQSLSMISTLLHLFRLLPFLCGGHCQLALENVTLHHQLAVYKRTVSRPKLRSRDRLFGQPDRILSLGKERDHGD